MNDRIFEGVLLASDFDATLTDSKGDILPCDIEAIKYFTSKGGLFTVSTGRTKQGFIAWKSIPFNAPVLLGNGVMSYDYTNNKTIYADAIDDRVIPFLELLSNSFPDISIELYGTDFSSFCYHPDDTSAYHFGYQKIEWSEIKDFREAHYPLVKIMLSVNSKGDAVAAWVKNNIPDFITHLWNRGGFIEIFSATAGKGRGLLKLADALGIKHEDVYAAGDGLNDVDMLQAARISFSPSNSQPEVLEYTDIIVRDNDHGCISNIIEILESFYS